MYVALRSNEKMVLSRFGNHTYRVWEMSGQKISISSAYEHMHILAANISVRTLSQS